MAEQKTHRDHSSPHGDSIPERREKRTQGRWKRYLPTNTREGLTALVILVCLAVGVITFLKTGNTTLLLAILRSITGLP